MTFDRWQRCNPFGEYGDDLPEQHYIYASSKVAEKGSSDNKGKNLRTKSPTLAGFLSIVPGLGKIYCGKTSDGIFSFFFISGIGYLTYDTYVKKAYSSTVIWGSFFVSFYAGNIYGSADAAENYNRRLNE